MIAWGKLQKTLAVCLLAGMFVATAVLGVEAKTKLRYFTWATDVTMMQEDWIQPFMKAYPDIEIEYEAVPFSQFFTKLYAYCMAGNPPDLIHMSVGYVYDYAKKGLLVNLQPYFNRDMNPNSYFLEPMSAMRYPTTAKGDLYSMPFAFVLTSMYYNKSMFDQMGIGYPTSNWSWFDVRDIGKKLTRDTNGDGKPEQWGFFPGYTYGQLDPIIHAFGGRILDDNYNVRVDEAPAVEAVRFLTDMIFKDQISPSSGSASTLFTQGKLGMTMDLTNAIETFRKSAKFDWDITVMPKGPAKRVVRLWPDSFAVMNGSKNVEAAWQFIKFTINRKSMDRYNGERKIPVYRPLALSREWLEEGKMPNKRVFIESVQYGDPLEFRPRWGEWNNLRSNTLGPVWRGEQAPEYGLKAWADGIRAVLASPEQ